MRVAAMRFCIILHASRLADAFSPVAFPALFFQQRPFALGF
jgi:hypothetical protein